MFQTISLVKFDSGSFTHPEFDSVKPHGFLNILTTSKYKSSLDISLHPFLDDPRPHFDQVQFETGLA